jgi:hypothetical protein
MGGGCKSSFMDCLQQSESNFAKIVNQNFFSGKVLLVCLLHLHITHQMEVFM